MNKIVKKFKIIFLKNLIRLPDIELTRSAKKLIKQYSKNLTLSFVK